MIELTIHKDGEPDRKMLLKGGVYGMGRHEDNEIVLDDREVSRRHARLLVDAGTVVVEDLSSGNGTFVDGASVTRHPLSDGQQIEILPFTMSLRWGVEREARKLPMLLVTQGPDQGRTFPLQGDNLTIGRGADADVKIDDQGMSRAHALLIKRRGAWSVRDLDSANGVFVNDQRIAEAPIEPGDSISLGQTTIRYELIEEPTEQASGNDADLFLEDMPTDAIPSPFARPQAPAPPARPAPVIERVHVAPRPAAEPAPAPAVAPPPVAAPAPAPVVPVAAAPSPFAPAPAAPAPQPAGSSMMPVVLAFLVILVLLVMVLAAALVTLLA